MKNVQVRNVPEETHAVLRRRAAAAGKSLQEYLLATLNDLAARPSVEEVLARAAGRAGTGATLKDIARDVRADRNRS